MLLLSIRRERIRFLVVDMGAKVFFTSVDAHEKKETNLLNRLGRLYDVLGFASSLIPKELIAVKTHFGEGGCTRFLRPIYLARLLECLEGSGVTPFLTDSNTYYVDRRHNAVEHLRTAQRHGFYPPQISAPIVIADGLTGRECVEVPIEGEHFRSVKIASAIHESNAILSAAHFKGHVVTGFGGAIKNLGMGGASRAAKLTIHGARAKISDRCTGCGICVEHCPRSAIEMKDGNGVVDMDLCNSCGECSLHCYPDAIDPDWEGGSLYSKEEVQERIAEHVLGAVKGKEGKVAYFNFLLDITPECDCEPWSDHPIVRDIGIVASRDIVATDQASVDLVNAQEGIRGTLLESGFERGEDKFEALNGVDWSAQLVHAEKLGLGTREYDLVEIQ
jgi:uncharacterized Fe-S center protein